MGLFLRKVFFGVLSMVLTACGVGARGQGPELRLSELRVPQQGISEDPALRVSNTPLVAIAGPQATVDGELQQMSAQAGIIFAGQVLAIRPQSALGLATGWVEVEFQVEQAVRGCAGQATYLLHEWAGLWTGGAQRYTVGERLLMLLHTPNGAGLSSPVDGQDGAIPITGGGAAPGPTDEFAGFGEQAVDLRWIEARVLHAGPTGSRLHGRPIAPTDPVFVGRERTATGQSRAGVQEAGSNRRYVQSRSGSGGAGLVPAQFEGAVNLPGGGSEAAPEAQGTSLRGLLAMLGVWEVQRVNAAR